MPLTPDLTRRGRDIVALSILLAAMLVVAIVVFGDISAYIRGDWPTMFFPLYSFLGERLRAFDIPGWNPHQFSGMPFAGDPSSGWGYVLAMLVYALLPAEPATTVFIALHLVVSGIAAYVLARLTGLGPAGAFVAGTAYAFPWFVPAAAGRVLFFHVTAWLPIALIGIELARLPGSPLRRFGGLVLSGAAISQILAAWLGQSSYYALLVIGGWVAWRTLLTPPADWSWRHRLAGLVGIGGSILLLGLALNAAALLIRLDANARSNVAGGVYTGISRWAETNVGIPIDEIARSLAGGFSEPSWQYAGAAVIALALLSPFVAWRWSPLLFWFIVAAVGIILALPDRTPLHAGMYALLPRFELFHAHLPARVLLVVPLAASMLAGATADALSQHRAQRHAGSRHLVPPPAQAAIAWLRESPALTLPNGLGWQAIALVATVALAALAIGLRDRQVISEGSLLAALAVLAVAAVAIALPMPSRSAIIPLVLAVVIFWDPTGRLIVAGWGPNLGPDRSLDAAVGGDAEAFLHDNGAANFISAAASEVPGRYAGYDPALLPDMAAVGDLPPQAYRNHWLGPSNWLLVHDWATFFGIDDIQGYNPIHILRYGQYIDTLNGHRQEYHETNLFPAGLDSPLLDPLNLRYVIVPSDAPERPDLEPLVSNLPVVYEDEHVLILERPDAFPRAWLVHDARRVSPEETLPLLAGGSVDPRQTALLEIDPPELSEPTAGATERAAYVLREPDRLQIAVTAEAPALLLLSEIWDPGWLATVDGEPAQSFEANYIFRAIPVPAGEHLVEMRYDPPALRLGIAITLATLFVILAVAVTLAVRGRTRTLASRAA